MESETIYNLFKFIEDKKPQYKLPFKVKLIHAPETLTKEDLNVKGDLGLSNTPIQSLPDNLTVGGFLDLEGCKNITSLPSGLKVKGSLDLRDTNITKLPPDLQVGDYGSLYLSNTPIQSLPDGLKVGGNLYLENTPIQSLPNGLKVGGILFLGDTPLSKKYTEEEIEAMVPGVKGNIYL